jgi:hypothetical protein
MSQSPSWCTAEILGIVRQVADGIQTGWTCFAEMRHPIKDRLKRFGLLTRFGEQHFFMTLGEAVSAYSQTQPVTCSA